jgi:hypothetical protein
MAAPTASAEMTRLIKYFLLVWASFHSKNRPKRLDAAWSGRGKRSTG